MSKKYIAMFALIAPVIIFPAAGNLTAANVTYTVRVLPAVSFDIVLASAAATITKNIAGKTIQLDVPAYAWTENFYVIINTSPIQSPMEIDPQIIFTACGKDDLNQEKDRIQNTIVEVNAYRLNGQRITGDFNKQIKLTLPYDDINNNGIIDDTNPPLAEGNLKICLLNESNSEWQELGSSIVDAEANHISADISHFSVYILMSSIGYSSSLSNAYVWPNPFYPSKKPYITFSNITNFARIRIYTITGELVKEAVENSGVGYFQWDGKNNANKKTASGVYFYIISNNTGENKKGKIAVIR